MAGIGNDFRNLFFPYEGMKLVLFTRHFLVEKNMLNLMELQSKNITLLFLNKFKNIDEISRMIIEIIGECA